MIEQTVFNLGNHKILKITVQTTQINRAAFLLPTPKFKKEN